MFHPLKSLSWLSAVLAIVGMIPITRLVVSYSLGNGTGHIQSLVLGSAILVLSAVVLVAGLLADLIAQNRRLFEKLHRLERCVSLKPGINDSNSHD